MKWINVKDKLPDNSTNLYLVYRDGKFDLAIWLHNNDTGKSYWWNYLGITHWMELPEPPKE